MLGIVIFALIIWFIVQCSTERNQRKWKRRFKPFVPIVRHVKADIRATVQMVRAHMTFRREKRKGFDFDNIEDVS